MSEPSFWRSFEGGSYPPPAPAVGHRGEALDPVLSYVRHRYPSEEWPITDVAAVLYPGERVDPFVVRLGQVIAEDEARHARRKLGRRYRLERYARHWVIGIVNGTFFWAGVHFAVSMIVCAVTGHDPRHYAAVALAPLFALINMKATRGWYPGRNAVRPPA